MSCKRLPMKPEELKSATVQSTFTPIVLAVTVKPSGADAFGSEESHRTMPNPVPLADLAKKKRSRPFVAPPPQPAICWSITLTSRTAMTEMIHRIIRGMRSIRQY